MIPNPSIEVQTSPVDRSSVPAWFAEVVILSQHLATKGMLATFAQQIRLVRGRFGSYEPLDFLALLIGYAISGERTLADFFQRAGSLWGCVHGSVWTDSPSPSLQFESFPRQRQPSLFGSISHARTSRTVSPRDGPTIPLGDLGSTGSPFHRFRCGCYPPSRTAASLAL